MTDRDESASAPPKSAGPATLLLRGLLALVIAAALAAMGAVVVFFLVVLIGEATGADNQQGALAMGAVTGAAPLGAVVAGGFGLWLGWRWARGASAGLAAGIVLPVAVIAAGTLVWLWEPYIAHQPPHPNDLRRIPWPPPVLHLEVKLDRKRMEGPLAADWHPVLRTLVPTLYVAWEDEPERLEDGRTVLRMRVELAYRHADRALELRWRTRPEGAYVFQLPLGEVPATTPNFNAWRRADRVVSSGEERPAPDDLDIFVRWRIGVRN